MNSQDNDKQELDYLLNNAKISDVSKCAIRSFCNGDRDAFDFESKLANDLFEKVGKELLFKVVQKRLHNLAQDEVDAVRLQDPAYKPKYYDLSIIKVEYRATVKELFDEFKEKGFLSKDINELIPNKNKAHKSLIDGAFAYMFKNHFFIEFDNLGRKITERDVVRFLSNKFKMNLSIDHYSHDKDIKINMALKEFDVLHKYDFNQTLKSIKDGKAL